MSVTEIEPVEEEVKTVDAPTVSPGADKNKCVTVIFNPVSGQGDPDERKAAIEEALAEHGYRCQHLVTTPEQGAGHWAEQALADGVDLLAVSGGDGTVIETMSALIGSDVPLAIFPGGTGNLLSSNLNLPKEVPDVVHAALFGERRTLDLAQFTPDGGEKRCFAIIAGAGLDAEMVQDADREAKDRLGLFAYLLAVVKNLGRRRVLVRVRIDDNPRWIRRRVKTVMVANMGRLPGGVEMVPGAWPDDGQLDVTLVKAETFFHWARLAWSAIRRRLHEDKGVEFHRARHVEVVLSFPQPVQYDGEEGGRVRSFTVDIVPGAVQVMVPKDAPI